jgi:hypothetical protein
MRFQLTVFALWTALLLAVPANARGDLADSPEKDPDFEAFMILIEQTLDSTGSGSYPGDRSELYRYTDDGWQIQMMTVWDGDYWLVLALRLYHPERIEDVEGQWLAHYQRLLAGMEREQVPELSMPELFDVPVPSWLPALPGEHRSRRFSFQGFWYEARWINKSTMVDDPRWALRSYELVAVLDQ